MLLVEMTNRPKTKNQPAKGWLEKAKIRKCRATSDLIPALYAGG